MQETIKGNTTVRKANQKTEVKRLYNIRHREINQERWQCKHRTHVNWLTITQHIPLPGTVAP